MKKILALLLIGVLAMSNIPAFAGLAPEPQPVMIGGAMTIESQVMMDALEDPQLIELEGYLFVKGKINGYPVVAYKTEVGMVNATMSTLLGILEFNPRAVINNGTSGGHDYALHTGDIVLGGKIVNINSFKTDHLDEGAGFAPETWSWRTTTIRVNGEFTKVSALESDPELLALAQTIPYTKGNLVVGVIGSGDVWNREIDRILDIHADFGTSCEEMETFAIAQVCAQLNIPFLGTRILSNTELYMEDFKPETGIDNQEYVLDLVEALIATY